MRRCTKQAIEKLLERATGLPSSVRSSTAVSGGCIHSAELLELEDERKFFVKSNLNSSRAMFEAEATGLQELRRSSIFQIPEVLGLDDDGRGTCFLLMEFISPGVPGPDFFGDFGRRLARLHLEALSEGFGFPEDNFLGSSPQPNHIRSDWVEFWRDSRLGFQLQLAARRHSSESELQRLGARLLDRLGDLISEPEEPPSLLHGDLWSGNFLCDRSGKAVLIDPAVYYGRGEADLAMTRLFGGFESIFYKAYDEIKSPAPGASVRNDIYQLYHLLNHLNLFGAGYLAGCLKILRRYGG